MSEQLNEELGKLIQKAAIDGTLSKSAVKQFDGLMVDVENLRKDVAQKTAEIQKLSANIDEFSKRLSNADAELGEFRKREAELVDRESQHEVLLMTVEYEKKRVADHQNMVGLIFRNSVLRRSVLGQELVAIPGTPDQVDQYGNRQYGTGREPDVTGVPVSKTEEEQET